MSPDGGYHRGVESAVLAALAEVRPMLVADGGDIELVAVEGDVVKVRLLGACGSCPQSIMTLRLGVEREIRQRLPEIDEVVAV